MTGELSLKGKVLKIGGVKEKTLAGRRDKLKKLLFPLENKAEVMELKDDIKEGLEFSFVDNYNEVFNIVLS